MPRVNLSMFPVWNMISERTLNFTRALEIFAEACLHLVYHGLCTFTVYIFVLALVELTGRVAGHSADRRATFRKTTSLHARHFYICMASLISAVGALDDLAVISALPAPLQIPELVFDFVLFYMIFRCVVLFIERALIPACRRKPIYVPLAEIVGTGMGLCLLCSAILAIQRVVFDRSSLHISPPTSVTEAAFICFIIGLTIAKIDSMDASGTTSALQSLADAKIHAISDFINNLTVLWTVIRAIETTVASLMGVIVTFLVIQALRALLAIFSAEKSSPYESYIIRVLWESLIPTNSATQPSRTVWPGLTVK